MKKITKVLVGLMAALTLTVGTTTQVLPSNSDNSTVIVAEAANGVVRGCFNRYNWTGTTICSNNYLKNSHLSKLFNRIFC